MDDDGSIFLSGLEKFTGAVKACLWFLLGMLIPFVPWILYFAVRKGL